MFAENASISSVIHQLGHRAAHAFPLLPCSASTCHRDRARCGYDPHSMHKCARRQPKHARPMLASHLGNADNSGKVSSPLSNGHSEFRALNPLALSLRGYLPRSRWRIRSRFRTGRGLRWLADRSRWRIRGCFRTGCGLGGRSLARGILRWRWLGCRLNSWWCGFLPWARRVSLRAIHPAVANNFLRFGNFYSAFKTINSHLISTPFLF